MRKVIKYIHWLPLVVLGAWALLGNTAWGEARQWRIPAYVPASVDSIEFVKIANGVAVDSVMDLLAAGESRLDTTLTVGSDTTWMVALKIYFTGIDTGTPGTWVFQPPWASDAGEGSNAVVFYCSTATEAVSGLDITVRTSVGTIQGHPQTTNSVGNATFSLDAGTYHTTVTGVGYTFNPDTVTVTGADTFTVSGTGVTIASPSNASLCNVFGFLKNVQDSAYDGAIVRAERIVGKTAADTSGAQTVIISEEPAYAISDSTGKFELYLRRTSSFHPDTSYGFYNIIATYGNPAVTLFEIFEFYVPDTTQINLGDTLALR